ncbi:hypothetical protein SO802_018642 [Lithocarpus litseifolius]|uniref:Alkyl transferase n=1 Tax=Lithocarpus litseifolius TaxID=425828 RepID=A0AAW2CLJ1_9ROSI
MEREREDSATTYFHVLCSYMRKFIFRILSVGTIPNHIAFIMDGNRRYAKKHNLRADDAAGHKAGFLALTSMLKYCYELGIRGYLRKKVLCKSMVPECILEVT